MKVLNVMSRFNVGGTSQWLFQLSTGLTSHGIENLLVIGDCPESEREDSRINEINHDRLHGLGPKTGIISTIRAFSRLRGIIRDFNPDVVNTHTSKAGVLGRLAGKTVRCNASIVHTYHGHVLSGYFSGPMEFVIRTIEKALSRLTDYFLVSGEKVMEDIESAGIIRGSNVLNIWPAVPDLQLENRNQCRTQLGITEDKFVVGWLGRKVPIKRIDRILDLARLNPDVIFVIAGDGESIRKTYQEYFKSSKRHNVIELGFTSPSKIWAISDICLLTSDNEAMPISPIEASLAERPVIGVDAGATSEVILDGKSGILCPKDVSALSIAVQELASDIELRKSMGKYARRFALERFSPDSSVNRQIEGYRLAISGKIHYK